MMSQATSAVANTDSKDLLIVGIVVLPDIACQKKRQQGKSKGTGRHIAGFLNLHWIEG